MFGLVFGILGRFGRRIAYCGLGRVVWGADVAGQVSWSRIPEVRRAQSECPLRQILVLA